MQSKVIFKTAIALAVSQSLMPTAAVAASIDVGAGCTLSQAITAANTDAQIAMCAAGSGADTINLPANSIIELSAIDPLSDGSSGLPSITSDITIQGQGSTLTRADMAPAMRLIRLNENASLTVDSLTLSNGFNKRGNAIFSDRGTELVLKNSIVQNNTNNVPFLSTSGIDVIDTNVRIENSVITQNTGRNHAGFAQRGGNLELLESQIVDNSNSGGTAGVFIDGGQITIHDSSVSRNMSSTFSGFQAGEVLAGISIERSSFDANMANSVSGMELNIYNTSNVNISDTTVSSNSGGSRSGLGVFYGDETDATFTVTLDNVTASSNTATGNAGISINGDATINMTGGAIANNNSGTVSGLNATGYDYYGFTVKGVVKNVTISGNVGRGDTPAQFAGLRAYEADLQLENVTVSNGSGRDSSAFHISNGSSLNVISSKVTNNTSWGSTITLNDAGSKATFTDTLIADNTGGTGAGTSAGALQATNIDELSVVNTTFARNVTPGAGGAINLKDVSTFNLSNSTLSGNSAANGGGLYLDAVNQIAITNVTVNGNSASTAGASLSLIGSFSSIKINNTVFADPGLSTHCLGAFIGSVGTNNWFDDTSCTFTSQGPALLAELADNGGPTPTHRPLANSPLIDAGDTSICNQSPINGLDQRNQPRGNKCDIGAFDLVNDTSNFFIIPLKNGKTVVIDL